MHGFWNLVFGKKVCFRGTDTPTFAPYKGYCLFFISVYFTEEKRRKYTTIHLTSAKQKILQKATEANVNFSSLELFAESGRVKVEMRAHGLGCACVLRCEVRFEVNTLLLCDSDVFSVLPAVSS